MARTRLQISNLAFSWPSQAEDLFDDISLTLDTGWTAVIGENGVGKSTLLSLISGRLQPTSGSISQPESVLLCEQRTDSRPEGFDEFACLPDADAGRLASSLGIEPDWPWRWDSLSHGERKRSQLGTALWKNPEVLLVDEPTNHLDEESGRLLTDALMSFRGIGIIVSHDRNLIDRMCRQCLFLDRQGAVLRPGGVSAGLEEIKNETLAARREYSRARKELKRIENESRRRSREAAGADRRRSKRNLAAGDSDGREKIDRARITGKDGQAGRLKKQMDARLERARGQMESRTLPKESTGGITLSGSTFRSDAVARMKAGSLATEDDFRLSWPDLCIGPRDRIALVGPNGSGKSRFLAELVKAAVPPEKDILLIPQEISENRGLLLMEELRNLQKNRRGEVFSAVDRLGSDPRRLMDSCNPSPGETRKLLLALGLSRAPAWVVMDEPTNHMDLFSIGHIEQALSDYSGALFLVSHDRRFLEKITDILWQIINDLLINNH